MNALNATLTIESANATAHPRDDTESSRPRHSVVTFLRYSPTRHRDATVKANVSLNSYFSWNSKEFAGA